MNSFSYLTPDSLESALREFLKRENTAFLAGGTDLIPLLKWGVEKPDCLLNLGKVPELRRVEIQSEKLFIGSMVTLRELENDPLIQRYIPVLAESAQWVASPQIRNQGTLGGNLLQEKRCRYFNQSDSWRSNLSACFQLGGDICHQVPNSEECRALYYSDLAPVLLSFDACAEILGAGGPRTIPLGNFIHDHVSGKGEKVLLKGILISIPPPGTWGKFMKQSVRSAIDFPLANLAVRYSPAARKGGNGPVFRIFIGAMAPEPFSLEETARDLMRTTLSLGRENLIERAINEATSKMRIVRETAVTVKTKQQSLQILRRAMEELFAVICR